MTTPKEKNRETLQEIANIAGDIVLMEMFWDMFDDLSIKHQKHYIERAKRIVKDQRGIEYNNLSDKKGK